MKNIWNNYGADYRMNETSSTVPVLPQGVYKLQVDLAGFYLTKISDGFHFPYKVYGTDTKFINHVLKTWNNTTGNMGILLNGVKGTGKTVTAEQIANQSGLPVIVIPRAYENLTNFLNELSQDAVIFIDEFDKIFERYSNSLLTVMDGVLKTDSRLMFLLTSNNDYLENAMKQRPSRIRYIKQYGDLPLEVIIEVVDDLLIHKHWRKAVIEMISSLSLITMDLVKTVIHEVNIHDIDPTEFRPFMNIDGDDERATYNLYMVDKDNNKIVMGENVTINQNGKPDQRWVGHILSITGPSYQYIGPVEEILPNGMFTLSYHSYNPFFIEKLGGKPTEKQIEDFDTDNDEDTRAVFTLVKVHKKHSNFYGYDF